MNKRQKKKYDYLNFDMDEYYAWNPEWQVKRHDERWSFWLEVKRYSNNKHKFNQAERMANFHQNELEEILLRHGDGY